MGILKRLLFAVGLLLCFYPVVRSSFASGREQLTQNYRENQPCDGVLGILDIPKIQVMLPVYEGTSEEVLQKGVGHMEVSSPLGGGEGTHCLLAGHRGLPEATLFARLGELREGDTFYVEVMKQRYTYQVCEIRVVRPEETEGLGICKDRDLVSLITCTPYGINTHRLIVTGERMEEKE